MQLDKRLHHHQRGGALPLPPPPLLLLHAPLAGVKTWRGPHRANDWHGGEPGFGSFAYPFIPTGSMIEKRKFYIFIDKPQSNDRGGKIMNILNK